MLHPRARHRSTLAALAVVCAGWLVPAQASPRGLVTAHEAIVAVLADRLGQTASITIRSLSPADDARVFVSATPDPNARVGAPIWFTLTTGEAGLPHSTHVLADVAVRVPCVRAAHAIARSQVLASADVVESDDATGAPVHRLLEISDVIGSRATRPLAASDLVLTNAVAGHRAVEAGDTVTVIALEGSVQVTATLIAADAGDRGDVIRVVNHDTRRYLRARVVGSKVVEVLHGG